MYGGDMNRTSVNVTLEIIAGDTINPIAHTTKQAFNSGIRASEGLARDYARTLGIMLVADPAVRIGDVYSRVWRNGDVKVIARVSK